MGMDTAATKVLLKVDDVAKRLQVPRTWVYSHAQELGDYKLGQYLRFDWERVSQHLPVLVRASYNPNREGLNKGDRKTIERMCNRCLLSTTTFSLTTVGTEEKEAGHPKGGEGDPQIVSKRAYLQTKNENPWDRVRP